MSLSGGEGLWGIGGFEPGVWGCTWCCTLAPTETLFALWPTQLVLVEVDSSMASDSDEVKQAFGSEVWGAAKATSDLA